MLRPRTAQHHPPSGKPVQPHHGRGWAGLRQAAPTLAEPGAEADLAGAGAGGAERPGGQVGHPHLAAEERPGRGHRLGGGGLPGGAGGQAGGPDGLGGRAGGSGRSRRCGGLQPIGTGGGGAPAALPEATTGKGKGGERRSGQQRANRTHGGTSHVRTSRAEAHPESGRVRSQKPIGTVPAGTRIGYRFGSIRVPASLPAGQARCAGSWRRPLHRPADAPVGDRMRGSQGTVWPAIARRMRLSETGCVVPKVPCGQPRSRRFHALREGTRPPVPRDGR